MAQTAQELNASPLEKYVIMLEQRVGALEEMLNTRKVVDDVMRDKMFTKHMELMDVITNQAKERTFSCNDVLKFTILSKCSADVNDLVMMATVLLQ